MVAVTDTGTGMTAEVAGRAFEPFFTTKEVGKGTGLGLSMVYGFAQQSGGAMQIHSEPGQAPRQAFFPRVAASQVNAAPSAGQFATPAGSETILVVEDDDMVRRYVEGELKALGYRVIVDAQRARRTGGIARARENRPSVLGCRDARRHVRPPSLPRKPPACGHYLRILLTSGYTEHPVEALDGLGRQVRILNKPFRRHDLASMLRSVLKAELDRLRGRDHHASGTGHEQESRQQDSPRTASHR